MALKRWFRPERESSEGGLIEFRQDLLFFCAIFTFYATWLLVLAILEHDTPTLAQTAVILHGLGLGVAILVLRNSWPRLSSWLCTLGSLALVAAAFLQVQEPVVLSFLAVPVLLAGLLVGTPLALVLTVCAMLFVWREGSADALAGAVSYRLTLILALGTIGMLTNKGLHLIEFWEREATSQQHRSILELRQRQGELNRALKALDEAYVLLKRSRDELAEARQQADEARAMKEQFVANVSHELRTPLNLITGFAEIMYLSPETYKRVGWTPELSNDIREMYRASRHLQNLVDDILDLSRIDATRLPMFRELLDPRTVIAEAVETLAPLARQRGLYLHLELPDVLPQLFMDRTRIRQVLLNLLNNAVRFTDEGGITVRAEQSDRTVEVHVSDTGVGIPSSQLAHIFEAFHQVQGGPRGRGGTGLGLALSRQFVELHGGRMWADSVMEQGSVFHFSLPLPGAAPETAQLFQVPYRKQAERSGVPVIVVDPDPSIADMLSRYLGDRQVLVARNVAEAEVLIERTHPLGVIVNQMPDRPPEEWVGTLGEVSARYDVPILRCAIPSPSWLRQTAGLDGCVTKPVTREALAEVFNVSPELPRSILIVDDDAGFVNLMCRMLATLEVAADVQQIKAYTGAQALRLAREKKPDLVFLDLLMPEMDGFEVLQAIRDDPTLGDTRVVAVTATSYGEEALRRRGGYFTLSQPMGVSTGTLTELLNAVLSIVRPRYVLDEREDV